MPLFSRGSCPELVVWKFVLQMLPFPLSAWILSPYVRGSGYENVFMCAYIVALAFAACWLTKRWHLLVPFLIGPMTGFLLTSALVPK